MGLLLQFGFISSNQKADPAGFGKLLTHRSPDPASCSYDNSSHCFVIPLRVTRTPERQAIGGSLAAWQASVGNDSSGINSQIDGRFRLQVA
jgi:hypothetical protein